MSKICVNMSVCDKKIEVTAKAKDDGTFDVRVESDCEALRAFSKNLTNVTLDDVTNFEKSKINREDIRGNMSMICLAPIAVYQAVWMEAGMMSKKIYPKTGPIVMDMGKE